MVTHNDFIFKYDFEQNNINIQNSSTKFKFNMKLLKEQTRVEERGMTFNFHYKIFEVDGIYHVPSDLDVENTLNSKNLKIISNTL